MIPIQVTEIERSVDKKRLAVCVNPEAIAFFRPAEQDAFTRIHLVDGYDLFVIESPAQIGARIALARGVREENS